MTRGTRGVGMVLDQTARNRFNKYLSKIKKLKEARQKFENDSKRDITPREFAALKLRIQDEDNDKNKDKTEWGNCRKYRHFAAKDCSIENLIISIIATYPQAKEGRNNCVLGEAYFQYAINSCDEDSGGLGEKHEYENHEKRSEQLGKLKVHRGQETKKEQKFRNFVNIK